MLDRKTYEWIRCAIRIVKRAIQRRSVARVCRNCGCEFHSENALHLKFCSDECRRGLYNKRDRDYREANRDKVNEEARAWQKEWRRKNPEQARAKRTAAFRRKMARKWASLVKICKRCNQEFRPANDRFDYCGAKCQTDYELQKAREYNKRPEIKARRNAKLRERKKRDPVFRLQEIVRWTIMRALKKSGGRKHSSVIKALPYTIPQLKAHIEAQFNNTNGFTWENYGKAWDIDHIVPQCLFRFTDTDSKLFRDCWALTNLRPLDKKANQQKSAKVIS